jgi:hypothetical protein
LDPSFQQTLNYAYFLDAYSNYQQLYELSCFFLDKISGQQNVRLMSSDDDSMDATNSDTFIDDGTTKNDITEKSPSKTENGKKGSFSCWTKIGKIIGRKLI